MPLALLSTVGALGAAAFVAVLTARLASARVQWLAVGLSAVLGMATAAIAWAVGLTGIQTVFALPVIALAGFFAVVVTAFQREKRRSLGAMAINSVILTALVFTPAVTIVFASWYDPFATGIGYLDLGGALPTEVAAGAAVFGAALVDRSVVSESRVWRDAWPHIWPALGMWGCFTLWLTGLELAVDRTTPTILTNTLLMPFASAIAYSIAERARHRTNSARGIALAILAGCAAATPAAGYLIPPLAVIIALLVGALLALLPRDLRRGARPMAGALVLGGGASLLLLGFLAKDVGFIYTGQPELFFGQLLSVALAGVGGFAFGALLNWCLNRIPALTQRRQRATHS